MKSATFLLEKILAQKEKEREQQRLKTLTQVKLVLEELAAKHHFQALLKSEIGGCS